MSKKILCFLLLFPFFTNAQDVQAHINSLKTELKTQSNPERITAIYSDLTWDYVDISLDSALVYGQKSVSVAKKLNNPKLLSQSYSNLGAVYLRKENYKKSRENYLAAYKIRKANKDYEGMAKININLGNIYASKQEYVPATQSFLEAIRYFESIGNDTIVSMTKGNLGLIFQEMKNYPKAIKYLEESTEFLRKAKLDQGLCHTYLSLGDVYIELKDTLKGLNYYHKGLKNCQACKDNLGVSTLSGRIAAIKSKQGNQKAASVYHETSKKTLENLNSEIEKSNALLFQSQQYLDRKEYDKAYAALNEIRKIHRKNNTERYLTETYKKLVYVFIQKQQPDSTEYYFEKYNALKEKTLATAVLQQTAELETKYETAKKEKLLLQKEVETKRKTATIIILALVAFFIALVGFLIYRQQKLKNQQQQQEFQLKSAIAQVENQNKLHEQRLAISRDLHDNIGAQLTFIISSVENLKFGFPGMEEKVKTQLTKISDFTQTTIVELRDTIWAMNTNEFRFEDLSSRIYNFIEKAQSAKENIRFQFVIDDNVKDTTFSSLEGINLYRTIQEALNNAVKYAEANAITVHVLREDEKIKIEIKDDGKGFDIDEADYGNGLYNMKKRIEEIDGVFQIRSEISKGTTVTVALTPKNR